MNTQVELTMTPMVFEEGEVVPSVYLQMWPENVMVDGREIESKDDLQWFVEEAMQYGKVSRIDVKKNRNRNGGVFRSAFIHFHMMSVEQGKFLLQAISHKGAHKVDGSNKTDEPYQNMKFDGKPFFMFRENLNPARIAEDEEMTREQAVERCKKLEQSLADKGVEVQEFIMRERAGLHGTINGLRATISQLHNDMSVQNGCYV